MPTKPRSRDDFEIAIICALTLEADMVELILDKDWADESTTFGKAVGDQNCYTTGVIAKHNVVLAFSSGMGSNSAAMVATGLRSSYRNINIAFVVGICGVVPNHMETQEDIVLGDCIVSAEVIQYDFGRQYPGVFQPKDDSLRRANPQIRAFMTKLRTSRNTHRVNTRLVKHLGVLQKSQPKSVYPGTAQDRLFQSTYLHSHKGSTAECDKCLDGDICTKDCKTIGCLPAHLVPRHRLESDANATKNDPKLHFGRLGSANTVMKSGIDRDRIAKAHQLIAFEMEVSGVCDILPVVMVKSACDYADSHKSKDWQDYAAATAAAGLKAVLEQWESAQSTSQGISES